jgi:hypothetical protein
MNSEITLEINGYRRDILRYNYRFSRNTDLKGRPTTGVLGGSIYVEMESDGDSSILDMMLVDMNKPRPSFFFRAEPAVVSGRIRHTKDEMMLRELVFDEAYISCYGETMNATGSSPMITHFLISPTRLDINRTIRLDRRIKTTYGFWWEEYKEEEKTPAKVVSYSPPLLLVTSVKGKDTALPSEKIKYQVTGYNLSDVSKNDRKRVKWIVEVNGKKEVQKEHGEVLNLLIKEEWAGEEIIVMPYLKKETEEVAASTSVQKRIVVLFIGGAADKNEFYMISPTKLIKDGAMTQFLNWVKVVKTITSNTLYLGYDEVFRDEHVASLCKFIGSTKTPIYIVGHSLGGWNGAHLSQILTDKGYNIEMLITLDPVGEGGIVWAVSDIHYELPTPKANHWINISASPKENDTSDIIANIGERWIPKTGPDINYITKAHHGNVYRMFNEDIYQGKSAFLLLKECITKKQ